MNTHQKTAARFTAVAFGVVVLAISASTSFSFFYNHFPALIPPQVIGPVVGALVSGIIGTLLFGATIAYQRFSYQNKQSVRGADRNDQLQMAGAEEPVSPERYRYPGSGHQGPYPKPIENTPGVRETNWSAWHPNPGRYQLKRAHSDSGQPVAVSDDMKKLVDFTVGKIGDDTGVYDTVNERAIIVDTETGEEVWRAIEHLIRHRR